MFLCPIYCDTSILALVQNIMEHIWLCKTLDKLGLAKLKFKNENLNFTTEPCMLWSVNLMSFVFKLQEIGWRDKKKARRIIIVTTDGLFHYAGDGLVKISNRFDR